MPELLVATVLLGVLGGALTKLVVGQMRFFDNISTVRDARSVARTSMNVMLSDLRMVQDSGGLDSVASNGKLIRVLVPYSFGVFCGTAASVSTVSMAPVDSASLAFAKFAGYGWRNWSTARYTIVPTATAPVASGQATLCTTTAGIKTMTIAGRSGLVLDISPAIAAATNQGSAIFFYQKVTYSFASSTLFPGKIGLWRTVSGGVSEELTGPFDASAGFRFYKTGDDTSKTTVPTTAAAKDSVRGLDIVLTAIGSRTPAGRTSPSLSKVVTSVFFKNVRAP